MVPLPEVRKEAPVKSVKFLAGVALGFTAALVCITLGLLLMGEVASLVHWMIKR